MRLHRRAVTAIVAVGATALVVIFQALDEPAPSRSAAAAAATSAAPTRSLTEQEKDLLHDAEDKLMRSCMKARGFDMWAVPRRPLPEDRDFPYVIDDVMWASRHGYGTDIYAQRDRLRRSDPNRRYFTGLPPAERQRALDALHGERSARQLKVRTPNGMTVGRADDGCIAQAQEKLYGDLDVWFRVTTMTDALTEMRGRQVLADTGFAESVKNWSTCMGAKGFRFPDPYEARAAFTKPDKPAARAEEVRTAVAEARCASSSGLSDTIRRLDRQYGERLRGAYSGEVNTRLRLELAALGRAGSLVQTG
ncbi:hypothetical protein Sru01_03960 [Sphaerisporangium rufum]|uniref:Uncharacterized protein n=1 Tax=Sphaerisporangium rufum TaxID=1381558 RepID=A0A919QWI0_9ACTN|nr:hypothetical protein [Sphaerisporangium rufum]GII75414.1 hypothetical protein Sru01_03960 [Sphaerisporangium rufum]